MPEQAGTTLYTGNKAVGFRGAEAGQGAKYADIAKQKCLENFKRTWRGGAAGGIAGAGLTATPEFKADLATACPPTAPTPVPSPSPSPSPSPTPPAVVGGNMSMPLPPGMPAMNLTGMNRG